MSTLVTYPQLGHSYAINPGSPARGAMLTTSSIAAPHLVQARARRRLLRDKFDTIPAPCVRALLSFVSPWLPTHDAPVGCGATATDLRGVRPGTVAGALKGGPGSAISPDWTQSTFGYRARRSPLPISIRH